MYSNCDGTTGALVGAAFTRDGSVDEHTVFLTEGAGTAIGFAGRGEFVEHIWSIECQPPKSEPRPE